MDILHKPQEEFQKELIELRQEYNSLKELYDKESSLRNHSYDEMLETNLKLTLAMQGGKMAWWEMDIPSGNVTFDKNKCEMLGYPTENFKHYKDFTALVHPKDYQRIMDAMRDHFEGIHAKYEVEYRILASSGEYIWFFDYGSVVKRDSNGVPLICTGFVFNITERKQAELHLLKIMKALDSAGDAIAIADSQGRHFYQNKALSNLFGYETAEETEAAGGGMARVKDPSIAKQIFETILQGKSWSGELDMVTKSGQVFPAYERADAIKDKEGNTIGVIGIINNVTERKHAEKLFGDLIEKNPMSIQIVDKDGFTLKVNSAHFLLFGPPPPPDFSIFDDLRDKGLGEYILLAKNGEVVHFPDTYYNVHDAYAELPDKPVWISAVLFPLTDQNDIIQSFVFMHEDITKRKNAEELLLKSENMLQTVLDNFPGVVFWKDRQSTFLGCNQSCATIAGLNSPVQIVGKTDLEMPWASTEGIEYRKDDFEVMESGKERLHIVEMLHQSDGKVIWLDTSKVPMRDSIGQVIGVVGVSNDISTLKQAEQEIINTNKELAYKNEELEKRTQELIKALGRAEESDRLKSAFLANMSHEIRTPMNGILGFASLLKDADISGEERREYLELLERSGNRMLNIINDIVDISKIESGQIEVHSKESNINDQIDFIHNFFKPEVDKKRIQFSCKKSLSCEEAVIHTDREKIYAILTNLVKNAIKYTDEGSIEFGYDLKTEHQSNVLQFFVKDTGIGIPKNQQEAIFERFIQADITNKMARQGAGLGLSISKAFVELLGGKIWVSSEEEKGSTFYFTLPLQEMDCKSTPQ
jgi:PAS domain S-box-containing protein